MSTMASSAQDVKMEGDAPTPVDPAKADLLYDKCDKEPPGTVFFQRDLTNMGVAEDLAELVRLINDLEARHLFKTMRFDEEPCWKLRSRDDAEKVRKLNADERLLYHHIDQAQAEGIWSKALRARTNMTPQALNKCLKSLETKELVQMVMSVKHPNRKMYLLKHLRPSEDMAGGPWQSEGEFDTALIETISRIVEKFVEEQTCISVPPGYNDYEAIETTPKKGQKRGVQDIEDAPAVKRARPSRAAPRQVLRQDPKYPTAASLLNDVLNLNVIKGPKNIRENDMEQLLEMMVLEGRLEKLTATNYRLAMKNKDADEGLNGFVDAPCGTCPVFDLCGDSGEISARTCVYYSEWLSTGLDIS